MTIVADDLNLLHDGGNGSVVEYGPRQLLYSTAS
jgi:hypothetical protein